MTESAPPSESWARCCFCGGEIVTGPGQDRAGESARMGFLDLAPGDGAAAFHAREQELYCHVACFRSRLHDPSALLPFESLPPDVIDEEKVLDACAELVHALFTEPGTLPFRDRLFGQEPGRWLSVARLCAGVEHAERRLAEIAEHDDVALIVQHTQHPMDESGEYALVIFTEPYLLWTTSVMHLRGV